VLVAIGVGRRKGERKKRGKVILDVMHLNYTSWFAEFEGNAVQLDAKNRCLHFNILRRKVRIRSCCSGAVAYYAPPPQ
jgi:hypothetical protein